jgi:hypothetical protein
MNSHITNCNYTRVSQGGELPRKGFDVCGAEIQAAFTLQSVRLADLGAQRTFYWLLISERINPLECAARVCIEINVFCCRVLF